MKRKLKFHLTSYQDMRELSIMTFSYVTILALCFLGVHSQPQLNYSEVQNLGKSCPPVDSCDYQKSTRSRELIPLKERNCACDYLCFEYGDCCIDAPGNAVTNVSTGFNCYQLRQFGGVFMKDSCSPAYNGYDIIRHLCEESNPRNLSDPLGSMPVTDSLTGVTYKNYYCSICNDKIDNIVIWTPRLECPTLTLYNSSHNLTQEYVFQNLDTDGKNWGLYLDGDQGSMFFHDCEVDPVMPVLLESKIRLCKPNLVEECPEDWEDDDVRTMCRSYMAVRFIHGDRGFRNPHCALCNHKNVSHLSCQSREFRDFQFFRQFERHAFSLLLDINEMRGQEVGLFQICEEGDVYDPFFKKCRSLSCLPGFVKTEGQCVPRIVPSEQPDFSHSNKTFKLILDSPVEKNISDELQNDGPTFNSSEIMPGFENISGISFNLSALDYGSPHGKEIAKYQNCLLISLVDEDYVMLPNKSIYVPKYDKIYEPTAYHTADGSVLVCSHFETENNEKFGPSMGYVTIIGLGLSMFCLLLHFIAFCIVPDLQNLSGKNLVSQCIALFLAYCCFIIGQFNSLSFTSCTAVAFLTFYFFQVSFFWMAVMAYDVWRTLKMATTELRVSSGKQIVRFIVYTFFTWVTPLFIVILLAFAEYTDVVPLLYRPGFAKPRCWFKRKRALLVFFATPLIAIMLINILLFISSARMILMTTQSSIKQQNQSQRRNFKLYLRLALLMGLTWVVGLVAGYADISFLWYLFVILNTLQGLFIFIAFSCSTKVLNYIKEKFKMQSEPREYKSSSHSASTGSGCHTNSTNLHSNISKKFSPKLLINKDSASPTSSSASLSSRHIKSNSCF
ncbi:uncharacterized protein LOC118189402 [Stegodyphus dumicola]|uniref:uncharacterized protein LOC118189402 n=1 Tax=Stegodyphus dumicola TaxID=202533 RepID=UPI0015AF6F4F|nr:uncharacterized protein LOC118189402 [Stegodyphus dumicola]